ncbi:MAG: DUF1292 domain-containing protein [Firmicutes bacterium]|jgi:putative Holliday junction resolvase|nr:DUF1292 domain-containing protein [Bacillota bacterium]
MAHEHNNHDHDHEHDDHITLIDEDGNELDFTIVQYLEVDNKGYAVLLPEDDPESGAVIFRVETENGEEVLYDIEDDDEFQKVIDALEEEDWSDLDEE